MTALAVSPASGQEDPDRPSVGAAVQVTSNPDPARAHSSPQIAVNPTNGELVIAEGEVRNTKACRFHLSVDKGRSWFPGGEASLEPFTDCTLQATNGHYVSMQFDNDGVLWAAFFASDPALTRTTNRDDIPRHLFLGRSPDSGRSWETTMAYEGPDEPGTGGSRRAMIAVDQADAGNIYIGWQKGRAGSGEPRKAMLSVSNDGGQSFAPPIEMSDGRGGSQPRPAVDGDGVAHVLWFIETAGLPSDPPPNRPLVYQRSTDKGRSWSSPQEIDPLNAGFSFGRKPLLAADPNSSNLLAIWYGNPDEQAQRPDPGEPSTDAFDDNQIMVRRSGDAGSSWSEPTFVNDDAERANIQHYDPGISIAPNGRIDVAWYDFRNSPTPEGTGEGGNDGGSHDVYYSSSTDGGATWSTNLRVSDRIIDRTIGVWSNNAHSHTNVGIASDNDTVYVTWQDTRNGSPTAQAEDVYFAAIDVDGDLGSAPDDGRVPLWLLVTAAVLVGMGLTIALVLALSRQRTTA